MKHARQLSTVIRCAFVKSGRELGKCRPVYNNKCAHTHRETFECFYCIAPLRRTNSQRDKVKFNNFTIIQHFHENTEFRRRDMFKV